MVGCVGDDSFADVLVENLSLNNIKTDYVFIKEATPTGVAMIVVKDGDSFIIVDLGANQKLTPSDIVAFEDQIKQSELLV